MVRYLSIDSRFEGRRLNRVGIIGSKLFLQPVLPSSIEIWSIDTLYPSSWTQLLQIPMANIIYSVPSCSYQQPFIYMFVAGVENEEEDLFVYLIFRLNYNTGELQRYSFDPLQCVPLSLELPLETLAMRCDDKKLVLFDRSIVMGPIPFFEVHFDKEHFYLVRKDIEDVESDETPVSHCTRFPIPFDAPNKIFGRLKDDSCMMIYQPESGKWLEYDMVNGERFELPPTSVRGIRETYGRNGHRMGAVESPLTFHSDGETCIARIVKNERHYFYQIILDHKSRQFICSQRGNAVVREGVDRMFYTLCTDSIFAFVGVRKIAIVSLQPPRLEEASVWRIQRHFSNNVRCLQEALDEEEIKNLCKKVYESARMNNK